MCGLVSQYNLAAPYAVKNFGALLVNRVRLEGFIVGERLPRWPEALENLGTWVAEEVSWVPRVDRRWPSQARRGAFPGHALAGENLGKQLVKLV